MPVVLTCSSPAQLLWVLEHCEITVAYCPPLLQETLFPFSLRQLLDQVPGDISAVVTTPSALAPRAGQAVAWHSLHVFRASGYLGGVSDGFRDSGSDGAVVDHSRRDPSEESLQAIFQLLEEALDWQG